MAFADGVVLVDVVCVRTLAQVAFITAEAHRAAHVGDVFLLLHDVDDVVRRLAVQFRGVRIFVAQDVARKFDHHHLHTQADTEGRQVVLAAILRGDEFPLRAALSESRANHVAGHAFEHFAHVLARDVFRIDEVAAHLSVIVDPRLLQRLDDRFVGILQIVFSDQADMQFLRGVGATVQEGAPRAEFRSGAHRQTQFFENHAVDTLILHAHRHLIDGGHVGALEHGVRTHVAEVGHFLAQRGRQRMLCAQNEDIGLNPFALQLFDGVLRGFGLQLARSRQIRHIGQVNAHGVAAELPLELANGFDEGQTFDVADRTADFRDHKIIAAFLAQVEHVAFDFVGDVRNHLDGFAQVVAAAFLFDHALVDAARGEIVVARGLDAREALVVAEVEVRFLSVVRHVAFAVLIGVERTGVDIDVRVEFLDRNVVAARLEQFADRAGDDALAQRRGYAAGDEDIFCISHEEK